MKIDNEGKERAKEFGKLQKINEKLRKEIDKLMDYPEEEYKEKLWKLINSLVENELLQEELCD